MFALLDLRQAMTNEYFVQLPFTAIGSVFAATQQTFSVNNRSESEGLQSKVEHWFR